jgi:hypothetical protein
VLRSLPLVPKGYLKEEGGCFKEEGRGFKEERGVF